MSRTRTPNPVPALALIRPLNHPEREKVEALEHRRDWLAKQLADRNRKANPTRDSWVRQEVSALSWVIGLLRGEPVSLATAAGPAAIADVAGPEGNGTLGAVADSS